MNSKIARCVYSFRPDCTRGGCSASSTTRALEALHDDVQLLLHGHHLDKYLSSTTNHPTNRNLPYTQQIQLGIAFLTELHCPIGTREILLERLRRLRKRGNQWIAEYSVEFNRWLRKLSIRQASEKEQLSTNDQLQIYKSAMPTNFQIEFRKKFGVRVFECIEDAEAAFTTIENDFSFIRGLENVKPNAAPTKPDKTKTKFKEDRKTTTSPHDRQAKRSAKTCRFCESKNYKADNHSSTDCGRHDNPKNADREEFDTPATKKKFRIGKGKDVAPMIAEIELLQTKLKRASASAVLQSSLDDSDVCAMAIDGGVVGAPTDQQRITMEVRVALEGSSQVNADTVARGVDMLDAGLVFAVVILAHLFNRALVGSDSLPTASAKSKNMLRPKAKKLLPPE
ncbi:hypothetical protein H257_02247 [Aphanomyces astaci]|uniref:Retrotransposon gag domain-containing protein n=1 Tax=Aphanomyces astaci TaxID=112090 RepID=W4H3A7_APHAT|nr:hypothetical protein H257_02247 [Aphanomyces astaci]ETV85628.1 hypothetical protein H257_02247 [Aphanomyces astaci]|eukprot:XP_009824100.1 hypothetical protein H257_02247 [Aphanomyces astaci]